MKHEASNRKAAGKVQPIIKKSSLKTAVNATKFSGNKANSSRKKVKPIILVQKVERQIKKNKSKKTVQALKPKSKKVEIAAPVKKAKSKTVETTKPQTQKLKAITSAKKIKAAGKKVKPQKAVQAIKPKTKLKSVAVVAPPKSKSRRLKPVASAKKIKPVAVKKISPVSTRNKKPGLANIKLKVSGKSVKPKIQKLKTSVSIKKTKTAGERNKQNVIAQKAKLQVKKNKAAESVQAVKPKLRRVKTVISVAKVEDNKIKAKSSKTKQTISRKQNKVEGKQSKSIIEAKAVKPKKAEIVKAKTKKIEPTVSIRKAKTAANETEIINLPAVKKLKKKKTRPIGAAVFRGQKSRYDFKVFPLDNDFEDVSAIYIISRRKIDRQKKGHHALVCIGQTDSVLGEIKRHKIKCIKRHNANVISILPETDLKKRLKIEEDLKSAHALVCNIG
jgi:hypothetical protein